MNDKIPNLRLSWTLFLTVTHTFFVYQLYFIAIGKLSTSKANSRMSHSDLQHEIQMENRHSCTELEAEKCMTIMNMLLHLTDSIRDLEVAADSCGTIQTLFYPAFARKKWRILNITWKLLFFPLLPRSDMFL